MRDAAGVFARFRRDENHLRQRHEDHEPINCVEIHFKKKSRRDRLAAIAVFFIALRLCDLAESIVEPDFTVQHD